tara:strand:- start:1323 stop:1664 length:342 start_codon:yes stop_codon:yes gene_type:complete
MNNEVMMTIKPDPVHLTLNEIAHDLTCMVADAHFEMGELLMFTKKELKKHLKEIAHYRSYNYDGREFYHWEYESKKKEFYDELFSKVSAKVLKVFPEFETEAQMPETFQEANA